MSPKKTASHKSPPTKHQHHSTPACGHTQTEYFDSLRWYAVGNIPQHVRSGPDKSFPAITQLHVHDCRAAVAKCGDWLNWKSGGWSSIGGLQNMSKNLSESFECIKWFSPPATAGHVNVQAAPVATSDVVAIAVPGEALGVIGVGAQGWCKLATWGWVPRSAVEPLDLSPAFADPVWYESREEEPQKGQAHCRAVFKEPFGGSPTGFLAPGTYLAVGTVGPYLRWSAGGFSLAAEFSVVDLRGGSGFYGVQWYTVQQGHGPQNIRTSASRGAPLAGEVSPGQLSAAIGMSNGWIRWQKGGWSVSGALVLLHLDRAYSQPVPFVLQDGMPAQCLRSGPDKKSGSVGTVKPKVTMQAVGYRGVLQRGSGANPAGESAPSACWMRWLMGWSLLEPFHRTDGLLPGAIAAPIRSSASSPSSVARSDSHGGTKKGVAAISVPSHELYDAVAEPASRGTDREPTPAFASPAVNAPRPTVADNGALAEEHSPGVNFSSPPSVLPDAVSASNSSLLKPASTQTPAQQPTARPAVALHEAHMPVVAEEAVPAVEPTTKPPVRALPRTTPTPREVAPLPTAARRSKEEFDGNHFYGDRDDPHYSQQRNAPLDYHRGLPREDYRDYRYGSREIDPRTEYLRSRSAALGTRFRRPMEREESPSGMDMADHRLPLDELPVRGARTRNRPIGDFLPDHRTEEERRRSAWDHRGRDRDWDRDSRDDYGYDDRDVRGGYAGRALRYRESSDRPRDRSASPWMPRSKPIGYDSRDSDRPRGVPSRYEIREVKNEEWEEPRRSRSGGYYRGERSIERIEHYDGPPAFLGADNHRSRFVDADVRLTDVDGLRSSRGLVGSVDDVGARGAPRGDDPDRPWRDHRSTDQLFRARTASLSRGYAPASGQRSYGVYKPDYSARQDLNDPEGRAAGEGAEDPALRLVPASPLRGRPVRTGGGYANMDRPEGSYAGRRDEHPPAREQRASSKRPWT